jgi:hypothetical protein
LRHAAAHAFPRRRILITREPAPCSRAFPFEPHYICSLFDHELLR